MGSERLQDIRPTHKSQSHFYILKVDMLKQTTQFIIAAKKLKHLGRHLTQHGQGLYGENYKMLWQKSKM